MGVILEWMLGNTEQRENVKERVDKLETIATTTTQIMGGLKDV